MSIFDKLSGFAQKAKENIVSKTLISKDKRLEQSLSERIKASDIYFEKVSTYGLPSKVDVVAFDCIAGLLAVGHSKFNYVKVFGKGISTTIKLPKAAGIKYLQFQTGHPLLIVIDKKNTIITVDLRTKSIRHALQAQEIITCHEYCAGTDWLFIGYANGYVDVFDIMQGTLSPYQVPNLLEILDDLPSNKAETADDKGRNCQYSNVVVDLQLHPTDLNTILIGYESTAFIWNIREATVRRSFSLAKSDVAARCNLDASITCIAWSPDGTQFVTGHDDGFIHLWDSKHDQKPVASRRVAEFFAPPNSASEIDVDNSLSGPIYQIAWYTNDKMQKTYMLIAADLEAHQIHGLNILEYDISNSDSNNNRVVKKQTLLPLPTDLSHFLILSTNPYRSGMHNPLGVAVIDTNHCLHVYSLEHGYPQLKLPPAFDFINPAMLNACYIPNIPQTVFQKVAAYTIQDRKTQYLPIAGGIAGPDHVYHLNSNDILLTIHQGEILKFWDASYTGLRPLSHLTIHCLKEPVSDDAFVCCVDLNKKTGAIAVGLSDGSVLIYQYHPDPDTPADIDPKFISKRNEEFIDSCDDTLKEISDLLADMQADEEGVEENAERNSGITKDSQQSTNPFLTSESQQVKERPSGQNYQSNTSGPTHLQSDNSAMKPVSFTSMHSEVLSSGYHPCLFITLGSAVRSIISLDDSIIAVALDNGHLTIIDTQNESVLNAIDIVRYDIEHKSAPVTVETAKGQPDINTGSQKDISEPTPTIASMHFFNTYSPSKVMTITTQLFVSLSNGHIYQLELADIEKGTNLSEYLICNVTAGSAVIDMHVVDLLEGKPQGTIDVISSRESNSSPSTLTKISTAGSSENFDGHSVNDNCKDTVSSISKSTATSSSNTTQHQSRNGESSMASDTTSYPSSSAASKRMQAIGKGEYRQQENPHLLVCTTTTGVSVFMTGHNIKLFSKELREDATVVRSEIISTQEGACLCLLLSNGRLAFFALPSLESIIDMSLPNSCLVERLNEAFLSRDGRVIFWTGAYELEQYSVIAKPDFPIGESIMLFDQDKSIPPHPCLTNQKQKTKKSWIGAVAGAFQKDQLTVEELDSIMGRVPVEDPNELRKQKVAEYKAKMKQQEAAAGGSAGNGSNVFTQLGQKMNERGEKLNELDKKFQDMNAASGDFLKAVREYTERQERKKWWEF